MPVFKQNSPSENCKANNLYEVNHYEIIKSDL